MKAYSIEVRGKVQGVSYRASAKAKADDLGITGWCKNQPDGSVLLHIEGDDKSLKNMFNWCRQGPRFSRPGPLITFETDVEGFEDFQIRR